MARMSKTRACVEAWGNHFGTATTDAKWTYLRDRGCNNEAVRQPQAQQCISDCTIECVKGKRGSNPDA